MGFDTCNERTVLRRDEDFDLEAKFLADTLAHPDGRLRQAAAIVEGCVVGGLKQIPERLEKHADETCKQALLAAGTGAFFGMAASVEAPIVAGVLALGGAGMTFAYIDKMGSRLGRDARLQSALDRVFRNTDAHSFCSALPTAERVLGKESFDVALTSVCGVGGFIGIKNGFRSRPLPLPPANRSNTVDTIATGPRLDGVFWREERGILYPTNRVGSKGEK